MDASRRQPWVRAAVLLGIVYSAIGILFALPRSHAIGWRWAAWMVSGVAYGGHIWYEHFRLRNPPRASALHVATGAALGALGLTISGMIHSLWTTSTVRPVWFLALVLSPALTGVPAFLVALVAEMILGRLPGKARAE